jgi:hypothetical protein
MSIPVFLFMTLCLEACDYYESKVVDAGYYQCVCESAEHGEFNVYIAYSYA